LTGDYIYHDGSDIYCLDQCNSEGFFIVTPGNLECKACHSTCFKCSGEVKIKKQLIIIKIKIKKIKKLFQFLIHNKILKYLNFLNKIINTINVF
jgi:hypothetical protein